MTKFSGLVIQIFLLISFPLVSLGYGPADVEASETRSHVGSGESFAEACAQSAQATGCEQGSDGYQQFIRLVTNAPYGCEVSCQNPTLESRYKNAMCRHCGEDASCWSACHQLYAGRFSGCRHCGMQRDCWSACVETLDVTAEAGPLNGSQQPVTVAN